VVDGAFAQGARHPVGAQEVLEALWVGPVAAVEALQVRAVLVPAVHCALLSKLAARLRRITTVFVAVGVGAGGSCRQASQEGVDRGRSVKVGVVLTVLVQTTLQNLLPPLALKLFLASGCSFLSGIISVFFPTVSGFVTRMNFSAHS